MCLAVVGHVLGCRRVRSLVALRRPAWYALLLAACGGPGAGSRAQARSDAVAEVGEAAISASDVTAYAGRARIDPRAALDELITIEVLAQEARRRGIVPGPAEIDEQRRASVRALLRRDFEATHRKQDIPRARLVDAYERRRMFFVHPPIRRVHNILAPEKPPRPGSDAFERIRSLVVEARQRRLSPEALLSRAEATGLHVDRDLSTYAGDPRFVAKWVDAVTRGPFSPGGLTEPFGTDEFGWHVVVFLEQKPARNTALEEALPEIRERLFDEYRAAEFGPWLASQLERHQVLRRPELLAAEATRARSDP